LLKLGISISERTVSRYLRGRPTTRSQTWRTFFANHLGGQTPISPVMFADAHEEDIVVDPCDLLFRPAPSIDASRASIYRPSVDWGGPLQPSAAGARLGKNHLQNGTEARKSSGRDPPAPTVGVSISKASHMFGPACCARPHSHFPFPDHDVTCTGIVLQCIILLETREYILPVSW